MRRGRATTVVGALALGVLALLVTGCSDRDAAGEPSGAGPSAGASASPSSPSVRVEPGLVFQEADGSRSELAADACLPASGSAVPVVVLLHGGGFVSGTRENLGDLCRDLADAGYAAFSVDYGLAPESVFPSQTRDVEAALAWVRDPAQVERFDLDPTRVALLGSSAGAILAQEVGTSDAGAGLAAVVSFSGVSLMTAEALQLGTPTKEGAAMVLAYLDCRAPTATACPQAADASALLSVDAGDPPMLLFTSDDEIVPVEQAEAMHAALQEAGVASELHVVPGSAHGIEVLDEVGLEPLTGFLDRAFGT